MTNRDFIIKNISNTDIRNELELIGFDKNYINEASDKYKYKNIKIYNLSPAQANIIKQIALSVGSDCAVHRDVITGKIDTSDVILGGSYSELNKIAEKLKSQPFSLKHLSENIKNELKPKQKVPKIMGILNITPDSFSDGGMYNTVESAAEHINKMITDGADIIDIGAESTRPGASPVDSDEQLRRLHPVLEYIKKSKISTPVSIDTRSSIVAKECLEMGARIINDVSGLKYDDNMAKVIADHNAAVIIQHSLGNDVTKKDNCYKNIVDDIFIDLYKQTKYAESFGIKNIITDIGIGFDKTRDEDLVLLDRIEEFSSLGYPVMVGLSRKSFLGLTDSSNDEKDTYTLAFNMLAIRNGVDYIRVHNIGLHRRLIDSMKL